jgi:hypothetical protein
MVILELRAKPEAKANVTFAGDGTIIQGGSGPGSNPKGHIV